MAAEPRIAQPGDICILLVPGPEDIPYLEQLQAGLQAVFGGKPHTAVHLTCQRFEAPEAEISAIAQGLRESLSSRPPFPLNAIAFKVSEHGFWRTRLLRWEVEFSADLQRTVTQVEGVLTTAGIEPHYPLGAGWKPVVVTALEDVPPNNPDLPAAGPSFPYPVFTVRSVIVSRITGWREFTILDRIELQEPASSLPLKGAGD